MRRSLETRKSSPKDANEVPRDGQDSTMGSEAAQEVASISGAFIAVTSAQGQGTVNLDDGFVAEDYWHHHCY